MSGEQQRKLRSMEKSSSSPSSHISSPVTNSATSKLWNKIELRLNKIETRLESISKTIVSQLKSEINTMNQTLSSRINNLELDVDEKTKTLTKSFNEQHNALTLRINNSELDFDDKIKKLENTFNQRLGSFNHSLFTLGNRLDTLEQQGSRMDTHEEELSLVKAQMLEKDNTMLKMEIDALARNNISGDLVLHGIPIRNNENLRNIFDRFCSLINYVPSSPIHILRTKPKNSSTTTSAIIVKLPHAQDKVNVLKSATAYYKLNSKAVTLTDLGFEGNKFVRVYESLTRHNHSIYRKAIEFRKKGILHAVLTRQGRVYVRQTNGDDVV